jgi:hypothetical protein
VTDARITKSGLGREAARFRGALSVMPPSRFTGIVKTSFSSWLGERWGVGGGRLRAPVQKSFRRQKSPFEPMYGRPGRQMVPANYAFYSTLSLAVTLRPMVSMFRPEAQPSPVFEAPALRPGLARENPMTMRLRHQLWSGFHLLREAGPKIGWQHDWEKGRERSLILLFAGAGLPVRVESVPELMRVLSTSVAGGAAPSPVFMQFGRSTRSFKEQLISMIRSENRSVGAGLSRVGPRIGSVVSLRPALVMSGAWRPALLQRDSADLRWANGASVQRPAAGAVLRLPILANLTRTGDSAEPRSWSSLFLDALGTRAAAVSTGSAFGTLRLTLPLPANREAEARRAPYRSPSALQYVQQEALLARSVREAMRDLQQSLRNYQTPAAAPPPPQIDQLSRQVYDQLKRELRIERERRGL